MMKTTIRALAAALALAVAAPAVAAPVRPAPVSFSVPAQTAGHDDDVRQWLAASAEWNIAYSNLLQGRVARIGAISEGATALMRRVDSGDRAGARAWAGQWIADRKRDFTGDLDAFDALPTEPPVLPDWALSDPEPVALRAGYVEFRDNVGSFLRRTNVAFDDFSGLMIQATSGRSQDRLALVNGMMILTGANVESEIVLLRTMQSRPGNPQHHLITAMLESDYALSAWIQHFTATLTGKPSDAAAAAAEIGQRADAALEQASELTASARLVGVSAGAQPEDQRRLTTDLMASYERSAEVERDIAGEMKTLAERTLAGDITGQLAVGPRVEVLGRQRMSLQHERSAMVAALSGDGG